ncbi:TatD family hydrolase [Paenibacillus sediminis]|uniref:TatD DNase family protein n=1 Tax=Paenibacillus sediminis TaxID=664909 RepID=A0ABS4H353_9BACL|nr:TatD family hydrolase [Paenibacillus sediminis]MBP1936949.1 TatD DNase family protein [Paenibacillus sediminis]
MQLSPLMDAHIHLDSYEEKQRLAILHELESSRVESVIAVSMNLASSKVNRKLAQAYPALVKPAFGFHPEQPLPSKQEIDELFTWMERYVGDMIAVGEVGLPYYNRTEAEQSGESFTLAPYIELLERFVAFAKQHDKPIVLHAVYEDADIACDLLEQYGVTKAHFHWFKGAEHTVQRMAERGYFVSFTPDIVYDPEIQQLAKVYPISQVMAETDGPWPFEGPFQGKMTHPAMTAEVVQAWCELHGLQLHAGRKQMYNNTMNFYLK